MRLDAYIRVSRVAGRNGERFISPEQQRDKIEAFANVMSAVIVAWHEDMDMSGGKLDRPGLNAALARIENGETGGLIVAKLDRFARTAEAGAVVRRIVDRGAIFASADERLDPTTPMGKAMLGIVLVFAEMELDRIRESWRDAQRRAVERGVHIASMPPTGYRRGDGGRLQPDPDAAPHIAEVFRRKAAGASWRDLAAYLQEHDVRSPYGNPDWVPRAVAHVVANRAYLGEARSGEFTNPDAHKPLVDEQTWQAAQNARGERPTNGLGGALLSGVVRCAGCGHVLKPDTMHQRGVKRRLYRCRTERASGRCPAPASVLGSVIEPFVTDMFLDGFDRLRAEGVPTAVDLRDAEQAVARTDLELSTYLAAVSAADVGPEAFAAGARQRRDAADQARDELARLRDAAAGAGLPTTVTLRDDWPNMSMSEQRALLHAGLDAVVVHRGREPIENRATVYWRGTAPPDVLRRSRRGRVVVAGC